MLKWLTDAYTWVKDNDLPNTFTFAVTSIAWPLGVVWWHNHRVNSVSNLVVAFIESPTSITVNGINYPAVPIVFENQTGSIVYITGPRIRNCSGRFPVPTTAVRDVHSNVHPLSFRGAKRHRYKRRSHLSRPSGYVTDEWQSGKRNARHNANVARVLPIQYAMVAAYLEALESILFSNIRLWLGRGSIGF